MDTHVRSKHKVHQDFNVPSSDRAGDIVIREKKQNAKIKLPTDSLKEIEKNRVKRQTQLFETGNVELHGANTENAMSYVPSKPERSLNSKVQHGTGNATPHENLSSSPYRYIPSHKNREKTESDLALKSTPNKPKLDVSVSKAIGEQAKARAEKMKQDKEGITPNKVPERAMLPPSPGIVKDKPRYPYKPSVETEVDMSKSESRNRYSKANDHPKKNLQLNIKSTSGCDEDKSVKTPSPPARPPPPNFNQVGDNSEKRISRLIAGKAKMFESASFDEAMDSKQAAEKPKIKLKPQMSIDNTFTESQSNCDDTSIVRTSDNRFQSPGQTSSKGITSDNLPDYAVVEKNKKVKDRLTKFENLKMEDCVRPKVFAPKPSVRRSSERDQVQSAAADSRIPPPSKPPPKPPRTFAYDEELKKKQEKREKKHKSKEKPLSPLVTADNSNYDKFSEASIKGDVRGTLKKLQSRNPYEEVPSEKFGEQPPLMGGGNVIRKKRHTYEVIDESAMSPHGKPSPSSNTPVSRPNHVYIKSPNPELKKKPIVARKPVSNPSYELRHECIPIKTFVSQDGSLKRYKSDESLFQGHSGKGGNNKHFTYNEEPVYYDPVDIVRRHPVPNAHGVVVDADGYAVPDIDKSSTTSSNVSIFLFYVML